MSPPHAGSSARRARLGVPRRAVLALSAALSALSATPACTHAPTGGGAPNADAATLASATSATSATSAASATSPDKAAEDPCGAKALRLGPAKPGERWQIPIGCLPAQGGPSSPRGPRIQSEAEFKAAFTCPAGRASGVDWAKQQLVVTTQTLSPAGVGWSVFDDGRALTIVSRFRRNCPNDPMPMPMSVPVVIAIPAGEPMRELKSATCTIESACP